MADIGSIIGLLFKGAKKVGKYINDHPDRVWIMQENIRRMREEKRLRDCAKRANMFDEQNE